MLTSSDDTVLNNKPLLKKYHTVRTIVGLLFKTVSSEEVNTTFVLTVRYFFNSGWSLKTVSSEEVNTIVLTVWYFFNSGLSFKTA
jgi:hypothetical protein